MKRHNNNPHSQGGAPGGKRNRQSFNNGGGRHQQFSSTQNAAWLGYARNRQEHNFVFNFHGAPPPPMFFQQFQSSISNPSLGNFSQYPLHPAAGASVPLNTNIQSFHGVTPTPIFEPSQLSVNTPVKTQCPANHHRFQCHSSLNTTGDNLVLCSDQQLGIPTPLHTNFQIPPHLQQGVFMPGYNNQAHYGHGYPQHPVAGPSSAQNFVPRNGAGAHANFQNRGSYQQQRRHRNDAPTDVEHTNMCNDRIRNFTNLSNQIYSPDCKPDLTSPLSRGLWDFFQKSRQKRSIYEAKIKLWAKFEKEFQSMWQKSRTHIFGSTLSTLGSNDCDIDLCIYTNTDQLSGKKKDLEFLYGMRKALRRQLRHLNNGGDIEVIPAKVPIMKFHDRQHNFAIDISCNTEHGTRNTHLLYCYTLLDSRIRPLICCLKKWASTHGINQAKDCTLSSYVISLLVIHYLQAGTEPRVIPSLQVLSPDFFENDRDIFSLEYSSPLPEYKSENKANLGSLFTGFFDYYLNQFDFTADVASVRLGTKLTNDECLDYAKERSIGPGQWRAYVCAEEPFDRSNAARAVVNRDAFDEILSAFRYGYMEGTRKKVRIGKLLGGE